jgi:hypothetical protein
MLDLFGGIRQPKMADELCLPFKDFGSWFHTIDALTLCLGKDPPAENVCCFFGTSGTKECLRPAEASPLIIVERLSVVF